MKPLVSIILPGIISNFLYPDPAQNTPLQAYSMGGIDLSDPSQGLVVQEWTLDVIGDTVDTAIYLSAPSHPSSLLFSYPNITWARLAFDQNMKPVISMLAGGQACFYWWDPTIPGTTITNLPAGTLSPAVTLDDKNPLANLAGTNDVVIAYTRTNNLYFRLQRDRYNVEYLWLYVGNLLSNAFVNNIGLGTNNRLLIEMYGSLYQ